MKSIPEDMDVTFLTVTQVIALHTASIQRYSPTESLAIRDKGLLESAVMTPQQTFGGRRLYQELAEIAAAYLIGLTLNHAFENGNKRVAFAACSIFLRVNGYRLTLDQDMAVALTLGVINHKFSRADIVEILNEAMKRLSVRLP